MRTQFYLFAIFFSSLLLSSCFYFPDLKGETAGSAVGAAASGVALASASTDLIAPGAGIIVGSVFGGMIGQDFDNNSPLRQEQPITDPIPLFYYQTLRPPALTQRFTPAQIITQDVKNG